MSLALIVALSGCATQFAKPEPPVSDTLAQVSETDTAISPPSAKEESPEVALSPSETLPNQELTPQLLYQTIIAEIAGQRGKTTLSVSSYLDLAKHTRDPRVVRRAIEIALTYRDLDSALQASRLWVDIAPTFRDARRMLATLLLALNKLDEVEPQLVSLLSQENEHLGNSLLYLNSLFSQYADKNQVWEIVNRLTTPYLHVPEAHFARAQALVNVDSFDRAVIEVNQAIALRPHWVRALFFRALLAMQLKDYPRAKLDFDWLSRQPNQDKQLIQMYLVELRLAEAQMLRAAGQTQAAYNLLDQGLAGQANQVDFLYESALLAEQLGHSDILETRLRTLIKFYPDNAHAYNALGYSLADRKEKLEEARQLVSKALTLAPNDPFIMDSMGWVLYRMGKNADALTYLQRAFASRADPEIAAHLGEVLWTLGRTDEAQKLWDEAAKTAADNSVLNETVKRLSAPKP